MVKVHEEYCPQNHPCPVLYRCPTGAIHQKNFYSAPEIDYDKCTGCGICTRMCSTFKTDR